MSAFSYHILKFRYLYDFERFFENINLLDFFFNLEIKILDIPVKLCSTSKNLGWKLLKFDDLIPNIYKERKTVRNYENSDFNQNIFSKKFLDCKLSFCLSMN